jgi:hypothetical protein
MTVRDTRKNEISVRERTSDTKRWEMFHITGLGRLVVGLLLTGFVAVGASGCVFVPVPGYAVARPPVVVAPPRPVVVVPAPVYGYYGGGYYGRGYYRGGYYRVR